MSLSNIYSAASSNYPSMLRAFYRINQQLRKEGIMAPSEESIHNTMKLYDLLDKPLDNIPTVHIGGTNGKGSTSFKMAESLQSFGYKTGLFVSPHLASFRERIQINSLLISEDSFSSNMAQIWKLCILHSIPATEFELTFLLASLHFSQNKCDAVVLEVGLGGELDATNVVNTSLSIVCSVALDHCRILGSTVEEIATKKAGIFKQNVPALVGPNVPIKQVQVTILCFI
eukprot:gene9145-12334_t